MRLETIFRSRKTTAVGEKLDPNHPNDDPHGGIFNRKYIFNPGPCSIAMLVYQIFFVNFCDTDPLEQRE